MGCGQSKTQTNERPPVGALTAKSGAPKTKFYGDVNKTLTRQLLTAFHQAGLTKEDFEFH